MPASILVFAHKTDFLKNVKIERENCIGSRCAAVLVVVPDIFDAQPGIDRA